MLQENRRIGNQQVRIVKHDNKGFSIEGNFKDEGGQRESLIIDHGNSSANAQELYDRVSDVYEAEKKKLKQEKEQLDEFIKKVTSEDS